MELTKIYKYRGISHCLFSVLTSLGKITTNTLFITFYNQDFRVPEPNHFRIPGSHYDRNWLSILNMSFKGILKTKMSFEEIIKTSNNILTNTYKLFVENDTHSYKAKNNMKQCWRLLTELCACLENFISYLLHDFKKYQTLSKYSFQYISLTQKAEFIWTESSILKKRIKQSMIINNTWQYVKKN